MTMPSGRSATTTDSSTSAAAASSSAPPPPPPKTPTLLLLRHSAAATEDSHPPPPPPLRHRRRRLPPPTKTPTLLLIRRRPATQRPSSGAAAGRGIASASSVSATSTWALIGSPKCLSINSRLKHGRVRGLGLGPGPTHIWNEAPSPATCIRIATEARKKAEEETKEIKERMIVMEIQLAEMKAMMATILQNKSTDFQQSNYTPTNPFDGRQNIVDANNPNDAFEGEVRSSSSNHQFQSYQVHQTKKRRVQYEHETENNPEHGEK